MAEHAERELELGDVCGVRRLRLGVGEAHGRVGVNQTHQTRGHRAGIVLQLRLEDPGAPVPPLAGVGVNGAVFACVGVDVANQTPVPLAGRAPRDVVGLQEVVVVVKGMQDRAEHACMRAHTESFI